MAARRVPAHPATLAMAAALAMILIAGALWLLHYARTATNEDWQRLSDVGQAFGVISAAISAAALAAVALSLDVQRRHARVAQQEAVFTLRSQLLQFALDRPEFLPMWGYGPERDTDTMRRTAYASMVFAYLKMAYALRLLTTFELLRYCRAAFRHEPVAAFWAGARPTYLNDQSSPEARRFAELIDAEFRSRRPAPERAAPRRRARPTTAPATNGTGAVVVALGLLAFAAMSARRPASARRPRL